jgi:hypothetical protein
MTIDNFFSFLTTAAAVWMAVNLSSLRKLQAEKDGITERRLNDMEFNHKREIQDLQRDIAALREKHEALPCWKKVKTDEAATDRKVVDDDAPRRSIHVVSISNGGGLGELFGQMFAGVPPELMVAKRLFSVVEDDKKTAAQLLSAMASVDDKEVLEVALQGLIEREDYEFVQLVKDEIAKR